jgi:hypothetical protein
MDKNTCRSGKRSDLWNCKPHLFGGFIVTVVDFGDVPRVN